MDNIFLGTELIKGYGRKGPSPRCLIKIDLRKAYDSIEWNFLETMMRELGIPKTFVRWVMACVSTISYSILVNGLPLAPFKAKNGLRQGDLISPYLVALSMAYLTRCLNNLEHKAEFTHHPEYKRTNTIFIICR